MDKSDITENKARQLICHAAIMDMTEIQLRLALLLINQGHTFGDAIAQALHYHPEVKQDTEIKLPEGYAFQEDDHIVTLLFHGNIVASFSSASVDPREILKAIAEHRTKKGA